MTATDPNALPMTPPVQRSWVPSTGGAVLRAGAVMAHQAHQRQLTLAERMDRPLVHRVVVEHELGVTEDGLLAMAESGELEWTWDISSPGASRRELRVWMWSLADAKAAQAAACYGVRSRTLYSEDRVLELVLPWTNPATLVFATIRAARLAWLWTCKRSHILHLCRSGEMDLVCGGVIVGRSPAISLQSAREFLRRRRFPYAQNKKPITGSADR